MGSRIIGHEGSLTYLLQNISFEVLDPICQNSI